MNLLFPSESEIHEKEIAEKNEYFDGSDEQKQFSGGCF
jgi:hypothetical protein